MPNPGDLLKLMGFKNKFQSAHPRFTAFIGDVARMGVNEGDIIEVSLIKADGTKTTANMKVNADDVAMVNEIKSMR